MQTQEILGWCFNGIGLLILGLTIYYLNRSVRAVERQSKELQEQQLAYLRVSQFEAWSRIDEVLLKYPELTEIWAGPEAASSLSTMAKSPDDFVAVSRQWAFVSLVFEVLFRSFTMQKEVSQAVGGQPLKEVRLDHPVFGTMWYKGGVREDHALFPEYVDFVELHFLANQPAPPAVPPVAKHPSDSLVQED